MVVNAAQLATYSQAKQFILTTGYIQVGEPTLRILITVCPRSLDSFSEYTHFQEWTRLLGHAVALALRSGSVTRKQFAVPILYSMCTQLMNTKTGILGEVIIIIFHISLVGINR